MLLSAPPLGVPSAPLCLSVKRPILSANTSAAEASSPADSRTSRTTGSNGRECDASSKGTSLSRWVAADEDALGDETDVLARWTGASGVADDGPDGRRGALAGMGGSSCRDEDAGRPDVSVGPIGFDGLVMMMVEVASNGKEA